MADGLTGIRLHSMYWVLGHKLFCLNRLSFHFSCLTICLLKCVAFSPKNKDLCETITWRFAFIMIDILIESTHQPPTDRVYSLGWGAYHPWEQASTSQWYLLVFLIVDSVEEPFKVSISWCQQGAKYLIFVTSITSGAHGEKFIIGAKIEEEKKKGKIVHIYGIFYIWVTF